MKKLALLFTTLFALALSSCGGGTDSSITKEDANAAFKKMLSTTVCTVNKTPIAPSETKTLNANEFQNAYMTIKQDIKLDNGKTVKVEISWDRQTSDNAIQSYKEIEDDKTHMSLNFNYHIHDPKVDDITRHAVVTPTYSIKLGDGTVATYEDDPINFVVPTSTTNFEEHSIASLYAIENKMFKFCNSDGTLGVNNDAAGDPQNHYYVKVSGKVTYVAADKNFGILRDGDLSVYLYKINEMSGDQPAEGKYYQIYGQLAVYKGSLQLSFLRKAAELDSAQAALIADPVCHETTISEILGVSQVSNKHLYEVELKNIEYGGGIKSSTNPNNRFTFKFKSGSLELTAAYDYHTETGQGFKDKLADKASGTAIRSVKGYMIYAAEVSKFSETGHSWQLLVITADDITLA